MAQSLLGLKDYSSAKLMPIDISGESLGRRGGVSRINDACSTDEDTAEGGILVSGSLKERIGEALFTTC
jgi:hypothetical protein